VAVGSEDVSLNLKVLELDQNLWMALGQVT
jgi:hypothetical protein